MSPSNSAAKVIAQSRERAERLGQIRREARQAEKRLSQDAGKLRETAESIAKAQEPASYSIPGFFPTPRPLARRMVEMTELRPRLTVLEPSAGAGHIADEVRQLAPECPLTVVEWSWTLCSLLAKKGYSPIQADFLEWQGGPFDRILMNPPFSEHQDIAHIQHAYDLLISGGRVVAIMSEHTFFSNHKQDQQFRKWMTDNKMCQAFQLPEGTFKFSDNPTGVNTRIVVLDKPN